MIIREANTNDLPQLLEYEQCVVDYERPFNALIKPGNVIYYDLALLVSHSDAYVAVAELQDQVIATGYAQLQDSRQSLVHEKHTYIGFMYVSPEHRGKGIIKRVLEHLVEWSTSKGVSNIYLDVYAENESAIKAYNKMGFKPNKVEMKLSL